MQRHIVPLRGPEPSLFALRDSLGSVNAPARRRRGPNRPGMGSWPSAPESMRNVLVLPVRANGPHGPSVPQGWVTCSSRTTFDKNSCDKRNGGDEVVWLLVVSRMTTCVVPAEFHTV